MLWLVPVGIFLLVAVVWLMRSFVYRRRVHSLSANLARYASSNRLLPPPGADRIILFGDELAERWDIARDFPELELFNRGIAGETTLHLLARFRQDVVELAPRIVVLLGGANDSAWRLPVAASQDHFQLMARLAAKEKIEIVLASLLPVRRGRNAGGRSASYVSAMNEWLRRFASAERLAFADFHSTLADKDGWLRPEFTDDGLHPNEAGYRAMAAVLCASLEPLLERAALRSGRAATS